MTSSQFPDFMERKGSLFLRSDHVEYGRATLVSNWYQAREAEPMDNNVKNDKQEKRVLHLSTYNRLGNVTETEPFPISTSHDQMSEAIRLKEDIQPRVTKTAMLSQENVGAGNFNRDTGCPSGRYGDVLPRHPPDHNKRYFDTTHKVDYQLPFPYQSKVEAVATVPDTTSPTSAWKKRHSQFTDVDDYRRRGNNTWHEQSGCYANQEERVTLVPKTNPIPSRLL